MIKIDYPQYKPEIRSQQEKEFIFDPIRKRWVMLTPEEWVRQNFLQYLVRVKNYPAALISVEKEIKLGDLIKRFDIVIYDSNTHPWMIIECKEMEVSLTTPVLDQALRYNISLQVPYIIITNGIHCHGFAAEQGQLTELEVLPAFSQAESK